MDGKAVSVPEKRVGNRRCGETEGWESGEEGNRPEQKLFGCETEKKRNRGGRESERKRNGAEVQRAGRGHFGEYGTEMPGTTGEVNRSVHETELRREAPVRGHLSYP